MKIMSIFNNKGGVGKTTLTFHLAHALAEMGKRVLLMDMDPQCNLTIHSLEDKIIQQIWEVEDSYIEDFRHARKQATPKEFSNLTEQCRSMHFSLKPTEDGMDEADDVAPIPYRLRDGLDLVPGRLTLYRFENKVAELWKGVFSGDPQSLRTMMKVRNIAEVLNKRRSYDFVIIDTSPSLGMLNKVILSTSDFFIVPCMPDLFSLYGIRNIGDSLKDWKKDYDIIQSLLSDRKREALPKHFVTFLGFTLYNARKRSNSGNKLKLSKTHNYWAQQIPDTMIKYIPESVRLNSKAVDLSESIGKAAVMYSHNTLPGMAQKYHQPMWAVPDLIDSIEPDDVNTVAPNRSIYRATKKGYSIFAKDLMSRAQLLVR